MNTPTLHDPATPAQTPTAGKPAPPPTRRRFALGLDVDLHFVVTAVPCGHGAIPPAQKLTRDQLLKWVRERVAAGHEVHTVYEACGFGYTLHGAAHRRRGRVAHHHADAALPGAPAQERPARRAGP